MNQNHYKIFDIGFFCLLGFILSLVSELLFKNMKITFYVDFGILIALIVMMRWNAVGAISYVIYGIPMVLFRGQEVWFSIFFYCVIHGFIALSVIGFKFYDKRRVGKHFMTTLIYLITTFIILIVVKSVALLMIHPNILDNLYSYIGSMLLSFILVILAFYFIGHFSDGLITDMNDYFKETLDET